MQSQCPWQLRSSGGDWPNSPTMPRRRSRTWNTVGTPRQRRQARLDGAVVHTRLGDKSPSVDLGTATRTLLGRGSPIITNKKVWTSTSLSTPTSSTRRQHSSAGASDQARAEPSLEPRFARKLRCGPEPICSEERGRVDHSAAHDGSGCLGCSVRHGKGPGTG